MLPLVEFVWEEMQNSFMLVSEWWDNIGWAKFNSTDHWEGGTDTRQNENFS